MPPPSAFAADLAQELTAVAEAGAEPVTSTDPVIPCVLLFMGCWLIIHQLFRNEGTKCGRRWAWWLRMFDQVCATGSLLLLAPLTEGTFFQGVLYVLVIFLSFCSNPVMLLCVSITLGTSFGAMVWQDGLCEGVESWWGHPATLSTLAVLFVLGIMFTQAVVLMERVFWPILGSLLVVTSTATLLYDALGFAPRALFAASCSEVRAYWGTLAWALLMVVAVGVQPCLRPKQEVGGTYVEKLLEFDGSKESSFGGAKPPGEGDRARHQVLVSAISNKDGDISHFSESDQALIRCCWEDEDQANRIMWGGGLI